MSNIVQLPVRTGDAPTDVNLLALFIRADAALIGVAEALAALLSPLTYEQLLLVEDRAHERYSSSHIFDLLVHEIISDEFGRRHQQMDPVNYPPDGAA